MNQIKAWEPVAAKVQQKLHEWKSHFLFRAGRLTLIMNVLNSLSIYYMGMFRRPKEIFRKIVSFQRKIFWGGGGGDKKSMAVKWSSLELLKDLGV